MTVRRTDETRILNDHENRIGALERAPGNPIYTDDRVITDPVSVVTFDAFPSTRRILELTWEITTDAYPVWLALAWQGDYPTTENEYRWRLFGDVTADSDIESDSYGAIGGSSVPDLSTYGPHWGYVRFPDYNEPSGAHGIIYQGEGGISTAVGAPSTWLISGCGDAVTPLTEINVFTADAGGPDGNHIVAPSRLTLTCY